MVEVTPMVALKQATRSFKYTVIEQVGFGSQSAASPFVVTEIIFRHQIDIIIRRCCRTFSRRHTGRWPPRQRQPVSTVVNGSFCT